MRRHRPHLKPRLVKVVEAAEDLRAAAVVNKVQALEKRAERIAEAAEREGDYRTSIVAVRTLLDIIKALSEVAERESPLDHPAWPAIRQTILEALLQHPAALHDVQAALVRLDDPTAPPSWRPQEPPALPALPPPSPAAPEPSSEAPAASGTIPVNIPDLDAATLARLMEALE